MQKYGTIKDDHLLLSSKPLDGYKPVEYAAIPEDFEQTTHYVTQSTPIDKGEYIFVGIEVHELELDEEGQDEGEIDGDH